MVLMFSFVRILMANLHTIPRLTAQGPFCVTGHSPGRSLALAGRRAGPLTTPRSARAAFLCLLPVGRRGRLSPAFGPGRCKAGIKRAHTGQGSYPDGLPRPGLRPLPSSPSLASLEDFGATCGILRKIRLLLKTVKRLLPQGSPRDLPCLSGVVAPHNLGLDLVR